MEAGLTITLVGTLLSLSNAPASVGVVRVLLNGVLTEIQGSLFENYRQKPPKSKPAPIQTCDYTQGQRLLCF